MNKEELIKIKERILALTLKDLLDEDLMKEFLLLELALRDILMVVKIPKGFDSVTWGRISALKQNRKKNLKTFIKNRNREIREN